MAGLGVMKTNCTNARMAKRMKAQLDQIVNVAYWYMRFGSTHSI